MRARCVLHDRLEHVLASDIPTRDRVGPAAVDACTLVRRAGRPAHHRGRRRDERSRRSAGPITAHRAARRRSRAASVARRRLRIERAMSAKSTRSGCGRTGCRYLIHDLRQPLTAAMSYVSLGACTRPTSRRFEDLARVDTAARRDPADATGPPRNRPASVRRLSLVKQELDVASLAREIATRVSHQVDVTTRAIPPSPQIVLSWHGCWEPPDEREPARARAADRVAVTGGRTACPRPSRTMARDRGRAAAAPVQSVAAQGDTRGPASASAFCRLVCEAPRKDLGGEREAGRRLRDMRVPRVGSRAPDPPTVARRLARSRALRTSSVDSLRAGNPPATPKSQGVTCFGVSTRFSGVRLADEPAEREADAGRARVALCVHGSNRSAAARPRSPAIVRDGRGHAVRPAGTPDPARRVLAAFVRRFPNTRPGEHDLR